MSKVLPVDMDRLEGVLADAKEGLRIALLLHDDAMANRVGYEVRFDPDTVDMLRDALQIVQAELLRVQVALLLRSRREQTTAAT